MSPITGPARLMRLPTINAGPMQERKHSADLESSVPACAVLSSDALALHRLVAGHAPEDCVEGSVGALQDIPDEIAGDISDGDKVCFPVSVRIQ